MKKDGPSDSLPEDEIRAIERWESLPDPNAEERDRLAAEVERLRAELAAAQAAPPRPAIPSRETLGRIVREEWIRWAELQTNPKPSWLVPWEDLPENDREADRMIGETIAAAVAGTQAEPPRPAAIVRGGGCGEWHGFELREDAERFNEPTPLNLWFRVESWHWHSARGETCEHGVPEGLHCGPCNAEYKRAARAAEGEGETS